MASAARLTLPRRATSRNPWTCERSTNEVYRRGGRRSALVDVPVTRQRQLHPEGRPAAVRRQRLDRAAVGGYHRRHDREAEAGAAAVAAAAGVGAVEGLEDTPLLALRQAGAVV